MVELFPNLDVLIVRVPCSLRSSFTPELDNNILSGFAQASMTPQLLSITGTVTDLTVAQELLNSSAHSLLYLGMLPLGRSRL